MANVYFKQGTQAKLDTLRAAKSGIDGAFYLTNDTHRLYIGKSDGSILPVNEGVTTVASTSELPSLATDAAKLAHQGQFYYISGSNILAVASGSKWVQINPNTNTKVDGLDVTVTEADGVATINTKVKNTTDAGVTGGTAYDDSFTITGANGTTVSASGDAITITGDQYALSTEAGATGSKSAKIKLTSDQSHNSEVTIKSGSNVTVSRATDGAISIAATDTVLSAVAAGAGNDNQTSPSNNGFYVKVTDTKSSKTGTFDPVITIGKDADASYHFVSGTATLPVYTKSEIDKKINELDSMSYKGVVGTGYNVTALPTTGVKAGDTYKVGTALTTPKAKVGDLVIATGTEGTDGVLTSITWEVIPSGDDAATDTQYYGSATENGLVIKNTTKQDTVAGITIAAGTAMTVSDSSNSTDDKTNTITITHADVTRAADAKGTALSMSGADTSVVSKLTIPAVTAVASDDQGHITGITITDYEVKDTKSTVQNSYDATASTDSTTKLSTATITEQIKTTDAKSNTATKSDSFKLTSTSLDITATAKTLNGDGTVKTAPIINVEMIWDTF